jgi:transketolase
MWTSDVKTRLENRVYEISKKHGLSHLGSCIGVLPVLYNIYETRREKDRVVLSCGHAGLAWYVILEEFEGLNNGFDAEELYKLMGVHPTIQSERDSYITCSTGSLGMGLTVACGVAAVNPEIKVYCVISDGEAAEGCVWEALDYAYKNIPNLIIIIHMNGYSATKEIKIEDLYQRIKCFHNDVKIWLSHGVPFAKGLDAHYYVMKEGDYA